MYLLTITILLYKNGLQTWNFSYCTYFLYLSQFTFVLISEKKILNNFSTLSLWKQHENGQLDSLVRSTAIKKITSFMLHWVKELTLYRYKRHLTNKAFITDGRKLKSNTSA